MPLCAMTRNTPMASRLLRELRHQVYSQLSLLFKQDLRDQGCADFHLQGQCLFILYIVQSRPGCKVYMTPRISTKARKELGWDIAESVAGASGERTKGPLGEDMDEDSVSSSCYDSDADEAGHARRPQSWRNGRYRARRSTI